MDPFRNTTQPDWDWWGKLWPTPEATLRNLGVDVGTSLVEVGAGNGYFALPAVRLVEPAPVYAIDLDGALLEELDALDAEWGIENIRSIHGDACDLDRLLPEPVDVVLLANAFHGIDDVERETVLDAVRNSLQPDGRFVVVNWADRPHTETVVDNKAHGPPTELRIDPEETRAAIRDMGGFDIERAVDLLPYHYGLAFSR